ncbi:MAG: peptidoglycan-binding protein [Christensenellaceae bacterium]|nr:peptidoglycan-binding protein [Christensenellaceae bacterium]
MAVKYYRPRQQRGGGGGGIQIASTKRFLISIAIIAAIVVLIILLATQPWNAAGSEQNVPDEQASATDTVPAADTETADNVLDNPTEDTSEPAEATPSDTESADTATEAADTESGDSATESATESADDSSKSDSDKSDSSSSGKSYKTLKQGSKGDSVMKLQKRLSELGYLPGKATGYYGSVTVDCIKQFQEKNGLKVDGIAGSATQSKLYSDSAVGK